MILNRIEFVIAVCACIYVLMGDGIIGEVVRGIDEQKD